MLGIILEFDDIKVAVVGPHQMCLSSTAHSPYVLHSTNRQASSSPEDKSLRKVWFYRNGSITGKKQKLTLSYDLSRADFGFIAGNKVLHAVYVNISKVDYGPA